MALAASKSEGVAVIFSARDENGLVKVKDSVRLLDAVGVTVSSHPMIMSVQDMDVPSMVESSVSMVFSRLSKKIVLPMTSRIFGLFNNSKLS